MSSHYQEAYEQLGEERIQIVSKTFDDEINANDIAAAAVGAEGIFNSDEEAYWAARRDLFWVRIPGSIRWVRALRQRVFFEGITRILMLLEPKSTFNPANLWRAEKLKDEKAPKREKMTLEKKEMMRLVNTACDAKIDLLREIIRIRNSKKDLMSINSTVAMPAARAILLVELLNGVVKQFNKYRGDISSSAKQERLLSLKKILYEIYWALEAMKDLPYESIAFTSTGLRPIVTASLPESIQRDKAFIDVFMKDYWRDFNKALEKDSTLTILHSDSSLVSDTKDGINNLLSDAKRIFESEEDLIKLQLLEMSDSLPPLGRFTFGHSLDPWQKQVLTWIDEGKSVVISAPTSSGKTVLSTYVAVIFKSKVAIEAEQQRLAAFNLASEDAEAEMNRMAEALDTNSDNKTILEEAYRIIPEPTDLLSHLVSKDSEARIRFLSERRRLRTEGAPGTGQKILFVVPTEPLVWQVAAFFTKLLKEEGDKQTRVGFVTDHLSFNPLIGFNVMPQIVVGTPKALESALAKPRGLTGPLETRKICSGLLAGGFEHFDWVVYDEVHALDGDEGAALQRLIRTMNCPFLALSATIGNADDLRAWFNQVKEEQFSNVVHALTVKDVMPLVHQVRFINLQRYIWDQSAPAANRLSTVSPLAAVTSSESLREGILENSSLSFTSRDSFRVWEAIKELYPAEAVAQINPYNFFGAKERITLQRSKDYEDLMKKELKRLAVEFPDLTERLLAQFTIKDPEREFNLCEMLLELKAKDMTPCLPFHLNTFEAIRLFQQTLAQIEAMQSAMYPTYYTDRMKERDMNQAKIDQDKKNVGGNDKELREKEKAGEIQTTDAAQIDVYEPHPQFIFSDNFPLQQDELRELVHEMEVNDGFSKRDKDTMYNSKGTNISILQHPLIRGLRRGIGLFVDEVSFPTYRRCVQKLASEGALGVVISDSSLAFGVNMPFRTCVFCGEMNGLLDELMAQQMSGRAGRRGLDTQGNIIYAGIRTNLVRRLMIGKVSNITGELHPPRYDQLILQPILSPRHTGYARAQVIGGVPLNQFLRGQSEGATYLEASKDTMMKLGFIAPGYHAAGSRYIPNTARNISYPILTMMWELRMHPYESITVGSLFHKLIELYQPVVRELRLDQKTENLEKMEPYIHGFFSVLLQLVGRTPWRRRPDLRRQPKKFSDLQYFASAPRLELFNKWSQLFQQQQESIPEELAHLRDPVAPNTELDATFFQCCFDRNFVHTLDEVHKQEMKAMIWYVGNVVRAMHDCTIIDDRYFRVAHFVFRNAFNKLRYLIAELVVNVINFNNITDVGTERRVERGAEKVERDPVRWNDLTSRQYAEELVKRLRSGTMRPLDKPALKESRNWSDLEGSSWSEAVVQCAERVAGMDREQAWTVAYTYRALSEGDVDLVRYIANNENDIIALARAVGSSSYARSHEEENVSKARVGALLWVCAVLRPAAMSSAPQMLRLLEEEGLVSADAIDFLSKTTLEGMLPFLPSTYKTYLVKCDADERLHIISESDVTGPSLDQFREGLFSSWSSSLVRCAEQIAGMDRAGVASIASTYRALRASDVELLYQLSVLNLKNAASLVALAKALSQCSFAAAFAAAGEKGKACMGLLYWFCSFLRPTALPYFSVLLKALYDEELAGEETILGWFDLSSSAIHKWLPSSYDSFSHKIDGLNSRFGSVVTAEKMAELKKLGEVIVNWLQEAEEEDDDDEEEEDGDEEEED